MANAISKRVAEFISQYPPFDILSESELVEIAENIVIQYKEPNEFLFLEHGSPLPNFFLVRQGSVKIFHEKNEESLIDICDEGDIFGARPLIAEETYQASAKTQEECLIYAIPVDLVKNILNQNEQFAEFFVMGYTSDKPMNREQLRSLRKKADKKEDAKLPALNEVMQLKSEKDVLKCQPNTTISNAAKLMSLKKVGSIIIATNGNPLGIVTDKDLREKVATGLSPISDEIKTIMSAPVICSKAGLSVAEYMITMINHQVHHICITKDGTDQSEIIGLVADHDLLMEQGFNPAILIKEMRKSTDLTSIITLRFKADVLLQRYIDQEVNMLYIMKMMTGINNVLLCKLIEFAINKLGSPPCAFAWLGLGSQGRGEQMLRTDQDHALVFEDAIDEEGNENSRQYFIQLAEKVSGDLERFGFTSDIADISAANPEYCLSISKWKQKFTKWIKQPEPENILLSNIFFDFSVAYGDEELGSLLRSHLHAELGSTNVFLPYLAKNALSSPPPLSFFRNFIVESSGEHKDEFDLKLRSMMPLVDAARVLSLEHKLENTTNTVERFQSIASSETHHHELINELSDAYLQLMAFRTRLGLQNKNSGRYIRITELSKLERSILRNIFNLINDVQKVLKLRFHTNQIQA